MNNISSAHRFVRRVQELGWPKSSPKRCALIGVLIFILCLYYLRNSKSTPALTAIHKCVIDEFNRKSINSYNPLDENEQISYIGNGFIGMDVAVNRQLLIYLQNTSRALPIFTDYWPLVDVKANAGDDTNNYFYSDTNEGITKSVQCSIIPSTMVLNFNRVGSKTWEKVENDYVPVYLKIINQGIKTIVGIKCSSVPAGPESFRFVCIIEQEYPHSQEGDLILKNRIVAKVANAFSHVNTFNANSLDNEHKQAWKTAYENALLKTELCYSGHSTLLLPSKLWQDYTNIQDMLKTVEIWLKTLEQHGCVHVLSAGAHGVAQAFLLSLIAATFTHHRLEINLDPEEDLHRHIKVENLQFGSSGLFLTLDFNIDSQLKPYVLLSSHGSVTSTLYACSAGCLEAPKSIGSSAVQLAIKVTKPVTPILFLSQAKGQLEQLKETLHVIDVLDAPAHESEKIALHQHGENQGMPTIFWVILISLIVAFHLFFFKLLYTEWKNSNLVPYSKFSKKLLLKR